ncbi:hypothetical protein [Bradyrhizobium sp. LM2.9]
MDTQDVFLDFSAWPRLGDQIRLADDVAGLPHQGEQDVECATRQLQRASVSFNQPLRWVEAKRPEDEDLPGGFVLSAAVSGGHHVVALPAGAIWGYQPGARFVTFYDLEAHQDV